MMNPEQLLEENLGLIERICRAQCRNRGIFGDDAEEFTSRVKISLVEDDYRRIRVFQGKSLFSTYLHTVISRIFIDGVRSEAGRWRPSEAARKLGAVAIELEKLVSRNDHTFDEACHILQSDPQCLLTRDQLLDIFEQLPRRVTPKEIDDPEEVLRTVPSPEPPAPESMDRKRLQAVLGDVESIVAGMKAALADEDRLLLAMAFEQDIAVSEIARLLGRERAAVDRRIKKILGGFKEEILKKGLNIHDVLDALRMS